MKDLKLALYGVASLCALALLGLFVMQLISGQTFALFAVLVGLSLTIAVIVLNSNTPQKSVASMLRDDVDAPRSTK
jgi:hypothetical protein